jgi:hypothetical protein
VIQHTKEFVVVGSRSWINKITVAAWKREQQCRNRERLLTYLILLETIP